MALMIRAHASHVAATRQAGTGTSVTLFCKHAQLRLYSWCTTRLWTVAPHPTAPVDWQ